MADVETTPARPAAAATPATGAPAVLAMLEALCGPLLRTPGNEWHAGLDCDRLAPGCGPFRSQKTAASWPLAQEYVGKLEAFVAAKGGVAQLAAHVERLGPRGLPTLARCAFQAEVQLVELFKERGPLHDATLRVPDVEVDARWLGAGHLAAARRFLHEHLERSPFRPTIALDLGWKWHLVYALARPIVDSPETGTLLREAAAGAARFIHGARRCQLDQMLTLPLERPDGRPLPSKLLWAEPKRLFDAEQALARSKRLDPAPEELSQGTRSPLAMRIRTLPEGWTLEDLDLPPDLKQLLVTGISVRGEIFLDSAPTIVRAMALRRHGWQDFELLLDDARLAPGQAMRADDTSRAGLRQKFLAALADAPSAYPPRLPHGIRKILRVGDELPGAPRRYVVRCGPRSKEVEIEVSYDVLVSSHEFSRALGRRLGTVPHVVPSGPWREAISVGLRDPRILGRLRPGAGVHKSLEERLLEYAATAKPWNPNRADDAELVWPLLRDGLAVFPLARLREFMAKGLRGTPPRRSDVAATVRARGGSDHGAMRFGKRVVRVWTLPAR